MSRERKYRAWIKATSQMVDVYAVNPMNQTVYVSHQQVHGRPGDDILLKYDDVMGDSDVELMDYTNRKDKNDVEIFEGDIVRFKVGSGPVVTYPVTWDLNAAQWIKGQCALSSYQKKTEVIGNIYENWS